MDDKVQMDKCEAYFLFLLIFTLLGGISNFFGSNSMARFPDFLVVLNLLRTISEIVLCKNKFININLRTFSSYPSPNISLLI